MKKIIFTALALTFFSGCSISLSGNPDSENFDENYQAVPDFSEQENAVLNGE